MAGRLAPVPEESTDGSTAAYPPRSIYRDSIERVAMSGTGRQIRSTILDSSSQSDNSGSSSYSSDSGPSNSYQSKRLINYQLNYKSIDGTNPAHSFISESSAAAVDLGTQELKTIACQMVDDGYTQRMVQAFQDGGDPDCSLESRFLELHVTPPTPALNGPDRVLQSWFLELDVAWVLQIRQEHGSQCQLSLLQDKSDSSLHDLVERWIRGLTVTVYSIVDLLSSCDEHEMASVAQFVLASILKMLVFVDAVVPAFKADNLRNVLDMYICIRRAADTVENSIMYLVELIQLCLLPALFVYEEMLKRAISSTMEKVMTWVEEDDSWAIEIPRGGGEVHKNTRWIADCILSLYEAEAGSIFVPTNHGSTLLEKIMLVRNTRSISKSSRSFSGVRDETVCYLKDLLQRKSELCSDPSLRYLFLLNNSHFVKEMMERCVPTDGWRPSFEYQSYIDCYLDVSWGDVLSCIPKSRFPGPLQRWINTSSLVKFESAFNKTYQTQKFWKVPDPKLRDVLRRAIAERVVSSYRNYLTEHPELAEHVSRRNSTPEVLEAILGQIFEG